MIIHQKTKCLLSLFCASVVAMVSQSSLAKDFAHVTHAGEGVIWDLSLPSGGEGVELTVAYSPLEDKGISFVDKSLFEASAGIVYPFKSTSGKRLEDGFYTWTMRIVKGSDIKYGFDREKVAEEKKSASIADPEIDRNGRELRVVGDETIVEGREFLFSTNRNFVQGGSFSVINGTVIDNTEEEKGSE